MPIPAALREALNRAIDEVASDFVFLTDATPLEAGGPLIQYANQSMLRTFGYRADEVIGKSASMFWGPQTDMEAVSRLRSTIARYGESGGEFAAYRRDGTIVWVHFRGRPLEVDGFPRHWIALGMDITESRHQCEEIARLSQVQRDLVAMLAHDFRGPLAAISGFAELLLEADAVDGPQRDDMLKTIYREAQRLANLAADTLTISRMERESPAIVPARFDLAQTIRDIADLYAERGVVALHLPRSLEIEADPLRMRQVVDNLIGNAVKYSPAGSPVVVEARANAGAVTIEVRDRGIGIPPAEISQIFGRYARASNARASGIPGAGFGLYLAQTIVRAHGGRIEVRSAPGEGTAFTVHVPASTAAALPVLEAGAPSA